MMKRYPRRITVSIAPAGRRARSLATWMSIVRPIVWPCHTSAAMRSLRNNRPGFRMNIARSKNSLLVSESRSPASSATNSSGQTRRSPTTSTWSEPGGSSACTTSDSLIYLPLPSASALRNRGGRTVAHRLEFLLEFDDRGTGEFGIGEHSHLRHVETLKLDLSARTDSALGEHVLNLEERICQSEHHGCDDHHGNRLGNELPRVAVENPRDSGRRLHSGAVPSDSVAAVGEDPDA